MKKLVTCLAVTLALYALPLTANAAFVSTFDFETAWTGDYATGWENTSYRHGTAPVAQMMQQTTTAHTGSAGVKLSASDPLGLFWVGVNPTGIPTSALDKQYNPYLSAWYFEENKMAVTGQIFSVPDSPIADNDDWTDVQFGGRRQPASSTNFNFIAASSNSLPGTNSWVDTNFARTAGWHQLEMQLSSTDGKIHFSLDGSEVGSTTRDDYTNLGTIGLYTMFDATTLSTNGAGSYTIWDDVQIGSSAPVPEPGTFALLGLGLAGLGVIARRRNKKA